MPATRGRGDAKDILQNSRYPGRLLGDVFQCIGTTSRYFPDINLSSKSSTTGEADTTTLCSYAHGYLDSNHYTRKSLMPAIILNINLCLCNTSSNEWKCDVWYRYRTLWVALNAHTNFIEMIY